ncbi:MAG: UDP-N-acetylglucosamine 1-carboxyvinyltransferase [Candidatus Margulisiibacteriota bacterium]
MSKLTVCGPNILCGSVAISGSKNAALPILISTLLLNGESKIANVPELTDIVTTIRLLRSLGLKAEFSNHVVHVWGTRDIRHIAPYELITNMRASFLVSGPILARVGFAKVPYPGGCAIGSRPVDIHLKGFRAFGIDIRVEHGFVILKSDGPIRGSRYNLEFPSVGATENLMMMASLAQGVSILKNVAREPEIEDLANFLNQAGAKIEGAGTDTLRIEGVNQLNAIEYTVIPDRIEAATFLCVAAITRGDVILEQVNVEHIQDIIQILMRVGFKLTIMDPRTVRIQTDGKALKGVTVKTEPFPGFSTDNQAILMAVLALINQKKSVMIENIFENRYMHVMELKRMGAMIDVTGSKATIHGVDHLSGTAVKMMDLRGGAALLLAALAADGETILYNIHHIQRGYDHIVRKLRLLGAKVE